MGIPVENLNDSNCFKLESSGCETLNLHQKSGLVFLSCDDPVQRKLWWPPMANLNTSGSPTGSLFVFDLSVLVINID